MFLQRTVVAAFILALALQGCATPGAQGTSSGSGTGAGGTVATGLGALLGAAGGAIAAEALARSEGRRLHLSPAEIEKRKRGYLIAFSLMGAVGGGVLAGTVYGKLQEQGKAQRAKALQAAADQARPQQYGEPTDPSIVGTVTPGARYSDVASNRECVDVEDALKDAKSGDSIFVKMCRTPPSGEWTQANA